MAEAEAQQHVLTETEWRQLAAWNATDHPYPQDQCVHELLAGQAAAAPEAVAVVAGRQAMSYGELNRRANQLAHYLRELGVGPETLVGICLERSVELVIGLLAILKAGGAYVPLDPKYPSERLTFMLQDTQAPILLTQQNLLLRLSPQPSQMLCLDTDAVHWAKQSEGDPLSVTKAEHLAYVIYTSGSTGRPKGVEITHQSLLNLIFWYQRALGVTPADRATQLVSPAFDVLGEELWPHLTAGASIYLVDEETRAAPAALRSWLVAHRITIGNAPNVLAEQILSLEWPKETALRCLLTGGDVLQRYPPPGLPFALINSYGPTEATVVATTGQVPPLTQAAVLPSIGRPIDNTQIYLLDEDLRPVSLGEAGQIYIGGAGLARGYHHRPELTAERFIWHSIRGQPRQRLYKTGDIARYWANGEIEFLGRSDNQIKLRGYRIELNEIVCALNQHPAIQASVVIARRDHPDEEQLVAYIVTTPGGEVTPTSLQTHLRAQLPDYMVPTVFVVLDALPPTPHGKVDRAALPIPNANNTLTEKCIDAPQTLLEVRLAELFATFLRIEQVGLDDNFFMLGGHSLQGMKLLAQVAETYTIELSLRALFDAPTVRQLASTITQALIDKLEQMSEEEVQHVLEQLP